MAELLGNFTISDAVTIAILGGAFGLINEIVRRMGRKEEVQASKEDNQVKNLIEQVKQLSLDQQKDRRRIDWLEEELWSERKHSHRQHRGLSDTVDWGEKMVRWADGDQLYPYPSPPDFAVLRELLDKPRPRRPPPGDEPDG